MDDITKLAEKRKDGKIRGRAFICGGSVAGLFAVAVCSDYFESVLVIETEGYVTDVGVVFLPPVWVGLERLFSETPQQELTYFGFSSRVLPRLRRPKRIVYRLYVGGKPGPDAFKATDPSAPASLPIMRQSFETLLRRLVVRFRSNMSFITSTVHGFQRKEGDDNLQHLNGRS
ncbi:hypothetical protein FRB98_005109 [Tulasnella sp. 332]|nr:hypothetical protein FRB98_005109 [Tulasnella sp. 332]